jgi:acetylornithine deacetylase/succinyl-diaminopimelate desuccinylase-like protein
VGSVPIVNHDDNQHAANENLRLQNLWEGVETMAELMAMPSVSARCARSGAMSV